MIRFRLGLKGEKFRFEDLLETLYLVISLEDLPREKLSVKTSALLGAYQLEKRRFEREKEIDHQNNPPKP